MTDGGGSSPLKDLDARLKAARDRQDEGQGPRGPVLGGEAGAGVGYRVSVELFAGMLFGGGLGWLLDRWLDTKPWLMVLFFLLGAAAGLLNSYRAMMQANRVAPGDASREARDEGKKD
ncbi:MAG: AtpZ/AtpI family protein [Dongiaceae bacterium]